jgi:hypothetical protein
MRSAFFLFVFAVLAYGLWSYYVGHPDFAKGAVAQPLHVKAAVQPDPTPEPPAVGAATGPDLSMITIVKGTSLTHAKVESVTKTGIIFLCDQGLIEIPFGNLPPEFSQYYTSKIPAQEAPSPMPLSPTSPPLVQHRVERSAVQDSQDELNFTRTRMELRDRIKSDEEVMDQWYQQSSFRSPSVTESRFLATKADLDTATLQLAELEANGPVH